jgi:flagellar motor switch protein FliG
MNDIFSQPGSDSSDDADSKALQAQIEHQRLLRAAMRMGLERPSAAAFNSDQTLDAPARAAAFLVALGPQLSGQLLQRFSPAEAQIASSRLASVRSVPRDVLIEVLQRFKDITENKSELPFDADSFVSAALGKFEVPDEVERQFVGIRAGLKGKVPYFSLLCTIEVDILKQYLSVEHPQLAATVLAILPSEISAKVLTLFDKPARVDLVRRVATLSPIEGTMLEHLNTWISDVVRKHFVESKGVEKATIGGVDPVVELLSSLSGAGGVEALEDLRRSDPELAAKVEARMFTFDDFALLDSRALTEVLSRAARDTIAIALKGASESLQQKFFSCMTQRAADQTLFEMESNAAPRVADIQDKQRELVSIARSLEQQKLIYLDKSSLGSGQG